MEMQTGAVRLSPNIGDRARAVRAVYEAIRAGLMSPIGRGARVSCAEWLHAESDDAQMVLGAYAVTGDEYTPIGVVAFESGSDGDIWGPDEGGTREHYCRWVADDTGAVGAWAPYS